MTPMAKNADCPSDQPAITSPGHATIASIRRQRQELAMPSVSSRRELRIALHPLKLIICIAVLLTGALLYKNLPGAQAEILSSAVSQLVNPVKAPPEPQNTMFEQYQKNLKASQDQQAQEQQAQAAQKNFNGPKCQFWIQQNQTAPSDKSSANVDQLNCDLDIAQRAAQTAYETATHEENIAENKYDTLGLEASYLAAGQARRVEEIKQSLTLCQNLQLRAYDDQRGIEVGALLGLEDENGRQQWLFLAPDAAGLKVDVVGQPVTVITPRSPLGNSLLGKFEGDEVEILVAGARQHFTVTEAR